ncbi:MAG: glycosyltransferase [Candidatus Omnitrophica bacterium]|nr:glycosyltransferase [Candidatus Omnitrophota bacterium]MDD5671676.1 glycosyltransferase [Candidatus Omnitrophota bacterium]
MTVNPKVSIIMPSYNHGLFIREAIESVLKQTYGDWELLIVDDGSEDDSLNTAEAYARLFHPKIQLIRHPDNSHLGIMETYRVALNRATGNLISFLESDDVWEHDGLETKVRALEKHKDVALVYTDVELFGEESHSKNTMERYCELVIRKEQRTRPYFAYDLIYVNLIPTFSCVLVRAQAMSGLDFSVPDAYSKWLDRWLWAQIALRGKFLYVSQKKTRWRFHQKNYNWQANTSMKDMLISGSRFNERLNTMVWRSLRRNREYGTMIRLMCRKLRYQLS